jgi:ABC-2 type transport system ATP-binding protein
VGSLVALDAVTKRYSWRGPWVLSGVDLVARPGTLTAIVGTNGSGKSTLLRIAAGLVSPSGGAARVPAHVAYLPERQPARLKFSAAEYLANMGHIKGLGTRAVAQRAAELLERLGLQPNSDVPWETLSKGNRQKVLIAQAFLMPTALAVLDEPYSGLDDAARGALDELIAEALDQEAAVLLSAHRTEDLRDAGETRQLVSGKLVEFRHSAPDSMAAGAAMAASKRIVLTTSQRGLSAPPGDSIEIEASRPEGPGQRLVLSVAQEHVDDVLSAALAMGWSVVSVNRALRRGR